MFPHITQRKHDPFYIISVLYAFELSWYKNTKYYLPTANTYVK